MVKGRVYFYGAFMLAASAISLKTAASRAKLKSFMASHRSIGGNASRLRPPGRLRPYGFEERELAYIYAGADLPNAASFRVIERLGMKLARKTMVNGVEALYYVMSRDDYKIHLELDSKMDVK